MSFLDEAVYNVEKGAMPPDPKDLEDDDVVNIGEKSPDNIGYGKDPETGKFKSMSSNDAIKHFLAQVKQGVEDEGDEWPTLKEDLAKFIRKAGGAEYKTPFTDFANNIKGWLKGKKDKSPEEREKFITKFTKLHKAPQDEFDAFIKDLGKEGYDKNEIKKIIKKRKEYQAKKASDSAKKEKDTVKKTPIKEEDIKLSSDTTFTVDLKHLVKKHMNKGNDKESAIKFTKALMKKLHNKGEVNVDGTKVIFKEHETTQDVPLALPAAETPNFLGDDGMDYEGGMAKSQMLKMKKYVDALSNMIEDESQLESWVQAKLTKASDYMSAVYHYLDYQNSKMEEK